MNHRLSWLTALGVSVLLLGLISCGDDEGGGSGDLGEIQEDQGLDVPFDADMGTDEGDPSIDQEVTDLTLDEGPEDVEQEEIDTSSCTVCSGEGTCVVRVRGRIEDESGSPVGGAAAQLCIVLASTGMPRCLRPTQTEANGLFTINLSSDLTCIEHAVVRVVLPDTDTTSLYCAIDLTDANPDIAIESPFVIYATEPAQDLPALGVPSQERTVVFQDGLEVDMTPERFYAGEEGYASLASRHFTAEIPDLCFLEGEPALLGLYAFSPEGEVDGPAFPMRIPNHAELAAGTAVDLYILGGLHTTLSDETSVPEGEWRPYGQAVVNEAGSFIETEEEVGLPHLLWLGYRESSE